MPSLTDVGSHNRPPLGPSEDAGPVPLSNQCGTLQSIPLRGPASSLAHCPMSGSDTICNRISPPLANIVLLGFFLPGFHSRFLNASTKERFPHHYKKCFVPLPNLYGTSQSTPPSGPASSLAHSPVSSSDIIWNSSNPLLNRYCSLWALFQASSQGFKTRLLGRDFHTLIKNISLPSPTDVESHILFNMYKSSGSDSKIFIQHMILVKK